MSVTPYCSDPLQYHRRKTRAIRVGDGPRGPVFIGGDHPICVQSMTTTPTRDVVATVKQVRQLVDVGCELVRITAPTRQDADALGEIRALLDQQGVRVSLVADIHFAPPAAMRAADFVDKVRINPGNFADRKRFQQHEYTDSEYQEELERIAETFLPLVRKLKERGRCLRIGTNHGSLSDRIMNRFGDTPEGMVESALEYIRICESDGFRDIVLSMKASKPELMIAANRLLAARLDELGMDYPIHLGVTEAGDGEDGRIKSAIGIGALLQDGVGDTIRVSLTEDPDREIPVAQELVTIMDPESLRAGAVANAPRLPFSTLGYDPFHFCRSETAAVTVGPFSVGGESPLRVEVTADDAWIGDMDLLKTLTKQDQALEMVEFSVSDEASSVKARQFLGCMRSSGLPISTSVRFPSRVGQDIVNEVLYFVDKVSFVIGPHTSTEQATAIRGLFQRQNGARPVIELVVSTELVPMDRCWEALTAILGENPANWPVNIVIGVSGPRLVPHVRLIHTKLLGLQSKPPFHLTYSSPQSDGVLAASVELGTLLCDGMGDVVSLVTNALSADRLRVGYNILQGAGKRITKTEYISCPSCGRTLFDLQSTTERIKASTGHLKDVRIAVMGCVVNGPGEMADAHFGYVGSAPGLVQLYVGKTCVERAVPEADADRRLIELIKAHGRWVDPPVHSS